MAMADDWTSGRFRLAVMPLRILVAVAVLAAFMVLPAKPAAAETWVTSCNGSIGSVWQDMCVHVETGGKDYSTGSQWVSKVVVWWRYDTANLEAWAGDGPTGVAWYGSSRGTHVTWTVDKWIKSGSGVCGAGWQESPYGRVVGCIEIKV